jgi:hypothetical protein
MRENWQVVDVADRKNMTLIVAGAGAIGIQIVGVDESAVVAIRRIVDRVAIGVGEREL